MDTIDSHNSLRKDSSRAETFIDSMTFYYFMTRHVIDLTCIERRSNHLAKSFVSFRNFISMLCMSIINIFTSIDDRTLLNCLLL